jgi:hypothetical protein
MQGANLCLHCGAASVTRERVAEIISPSRTESWVPIPHHRLLAGVQESLKRCGLHVVSEAHGLTRDGARYFALLRVANSTQPDDFGLVVGLRNSNDQSFPGLMDAACGLVQTEIPCRPPGAAEPALAIAG